MTKSQRIGLPRRKPDGHKLIQGSQRDHAAVDRQTYHVGRHPSVERKRLLVLRVRPLLLGVCFRQGLGKLLNRTLLWFRFFIWQIRKRHQVRTHLENIAKRQTLIGETFHPWWERLLPQLHVDHHMRCLRLRCSEEVSELLRGPSHATNTHTRQIKWRQEKKGYHASWIKPSRPTLASSGAMLTLTIGVCLASALCAGLFPFAVPAAAIKGRYAM
jgi:hypothetical protein